MAQAAGRICTETLEMAPVSIVLYGSDKLVLPELNHASARLGKAALARDLDDLADDGMLSQSEAQESAGLVLAGMSRFPYALDSFPSKRNQSSSRTT